MGYRFFFFNFHALGELDYSGRLEWFDWFLLITDRI